jgi:hypothetical protein
MAVVTLPVQRQHALPDDEIQVAGQCATTRRDQHEQ